MEYYVINSSQRKCGLNHIKMSVLKGRFLNLEGHLISQVIQAVVVPESTFLFITDTRVFWSGKWQELLINWEKRGQRKFRKIHINGGRLNTPLKGEHIGVDAFCSTQCALAGHGTVPWTSGNCLVPLKGLIWNTVSCCFNLYGQDSETNRGVTGQCRLSFLLSTSFKHESQLLLVLLSFPI